MPGKLRKESIRLKSQRSLVQYSLEVTFLGFHKAKPLLLIVPISSRLLKPLIAITQTSIHIQVIEFFTVNTKLAEMTLLASKDLTTAKTIYLQWDLT